MATPAELPVLAAASMSARDMQDLLFWGSVLVAVCLVGVAMLAVLRRRAQEWKQAPTPTGFTLQGLRELLQQGRLTPEEFAAARNRLLDRARHGISTGSPRSPGLQNPPGDADEGGEGPPGEARTDDPGPPQPPA